MTIKRRKVTMDGNTAAAHVSYAFSEVSAIYPITPSSPMPEFIDKWAANGRLNLYGNPVSVTEMQHEAGAAGAVHGSLAAGALTSTYTASQGLLLMIPDMYKIAGERLPAVFHVAARSLSTCSINMYGDHQDVMAARATGFAMLASGSVQEIMDLSPVAHLSAIKARVPFVNFFDGFRTSHEIQKIDVWDYDQFEDMVDWKAIDDFKNDSLNPHRPTMRGVFEKSGYFQRTEAQNKAYNGLPEIVVDYMNKINEKIGTNYSLFNYEGAEDATDIIIAMGSGTDTIQQTVEELNKEGRKVGLVKVHLYRPFSTKHLLEAIPKTVERIAVLDRTKEKGSAGEPLYLDVLESFSDSDRNPKIIAGRYGLGQKDTRPAHIKSVFDNLAKDEPKNHFTVGIIDDVTNTSLEVDNSFVISDGQTTRCIFWGNGGDGTVGANKNAIKIIGDNTDMFAQGYFDYDAKKSNGLTMSHLRFSPNPIHAAYFIDEADFVSCSPQAYVRQYDLVKNLKEGGIFLLNTIWSEEELEEHIPNYLLKEIADKNIKFYTVNASKIAQEVGLGHRTNMVIQTAFFILSEVLPIEDAIKYLKDSIEKSYGMKGQDIVDMNNKAVDRASEELQEIKVKEEWKNLGEDREGANENEPDFIKNMVRPIINLEEDDLPVSTYLPYDDGQYMAGTSRYEKRGIALFVPEWNIDNCIQCNQCSYICPHATIRPFLLDEEQKAKAPEGFETKKAIGKGLEGYEFRIQVSPYDCMGCGNCVDVCPAPKKALAMKPIDEQIEKQAENWEYAHGEVGYRNDEIAPTNVKNSQFSQPLLEFSGACAGCGETPYAKLITQLYGDHQIISNATGCSSIWGSSVPSMPYCTNNNGEGPAWASSLFEDAAEYGYGMLLATKSNKFLLETLMKKFLELKVSTPLNDAFNEWLENNDDFEESKKAAIKIESLIANKTDNDEANKIIERIKSLKDYLVKKSVWIYGGDGWAYDIGFSGVDHVLASGDDINIIVFDTEVYSNTGGQSSKATPLAAVAKFAASGKKVRKKDLGLMMTTYGYVYVAQVAMGANQAQTLKAIKEAESYHGPSLIIAYAPCINHGLKAGMGKTQRREKEAVASGYWHLWRFNPLLKEEGKNPFSLDSKDPTESFQEFLQGEVRYASLKKAFPEDADRLYAEAEEAAKERLESYKKMENK
ncbi:MAG: pyruvate:ferredoxin (flavodoxin) oxidoreductase [Anaerococcus vaginalis]|uniref:pyruvate:ferredoxin (flavodoxin) oxidoreductase n=1 Tax=Anaerococcus vaginalis TaxID=33037 RepID=UPI0018976359|nr:pyruvate:ferredoxin (flavodoxin) oxidoreductase [Anaerococcus vaginalis]MBS6921766.1 pyruvate:ferredoxin (flavodoxin) oxidoreductase [Anaerococcus vaginalis]MDU1764066.1 pyruvate:ferredoxin (flavodoxin) oxidoreductase [Anaerococcus vaginalis]MDU4377998.1 pyruvate:ferredoxin (flavodoxin) oxidoreductase [Anaerococcus vaginalis]MDU5823977.1 pyruvate:ferredoxin (flavodoxin) oxidoreductase [Anaerococcus vaginalis]MDU7142429.1 pyruvate:ferredoxin (flavodoxin) oxidoreductase [Anaerococcus vaginali